MSEHAPDSKWVAGDIERVVSIGIKQIWKDENKNIVQSQGKYFANQTDQTQEWIWFGGE